jgi:hypothetical protein
VWIKVLPPFIGIAILWVAGAIWYWLAGRPDRERRAKALDGTRGAVKGR